nr:reverse transcriptase domain-containing protein [Tanacetum cinerariifolium]
MVRALLLDKKGQSSAPVKEVEESCVTCGGAHSYRNCPATDGNYYRDNIQEFVSQASAVNFNQGNISYRPSMMSNHIRPPGFPPVPNNKNHQRNNQNRFIPNQNQNRGNNFHQGPFYQPPVFQPPAYQAPAYQAPTPQTQGVSKEDFSAYFKANDAVIRNMQTQCQNMHNQLTNLSDLITKFVNSNIASTLNSGTLPSNTIANPRSDLKAITTRSGVSYDGPQIPPLPSSLPPVMENEPEATKYTVDPTNNRNTKDVQPQAVHPKPVTSLISEPVITSASVPRPNPKASIPYPSRRNDERNHKRAKDQIEKFYRIFKDMSFEISFADALMLMPKFSSTLKALIGNKEKLSEMARTPLNENCSAVLLKNLPKKLGDPGKFLISCDFLGMAECLALADLGASINLMTYSVWKRLSLSDLTPMCMTLELADRSITSPIGIAEDVYVKVGSFHFSVDFVVVDFDADPRVSLILERSFLKTERALIDVFEGELTLHVGKEAITFNMDQTSRYSANYSDMMAKRIDVIDMACEEYSQEVLGFSDTISSGNPTPFYDPIVSDAFLAVEDEPTSSDFYQPYLDPEGDILLLEAFLNDDPSLPPPNQRNYLPEVRKELKIYEAHSKKWSVDEPPVAKLKELPPHLEYAFLEVHTTNNGSTEDVQPQIVQYKSLILTFEPVNSLIIEHVASPVSAPRPNLRPSIPYPSRLQDQKLRDKANDQREKFFQIFKDLNLNISFADALILMPKLGPLIKSLLTNKDKLYFDADPRVPLILGRSFLKTERALIDVFEEVDTFLALEDDPTSPKVDQSYIDPEGDILLLEEFLNDDPSLPSPNQGNYLPEVRKELKICEAKFEKSSVDEPLEVELKDLPPHLEYAFLEGDDKLPIIISKDLSVEEKIALITVLKSHKRAIAWKLSDIKGIDPKFCTQKILMEEDFEPAVQHQRRVNPKIHDVIKQEVLKLLDAGLIYPISDSPWVSPVHCVQKKGGFTVVENEDNELILTRLVTGWRVCIDYRKLNEATRKDHLPLPFIDYRRLF